MGWETLRSTENNCMAPTTRFCCRSRRPRESHTPSPQTTLSLHSAAGAGDKERVTHQAHKLHFHYIQQEEPETKRESHTKPTNYTFITFSCRSRRPRESHTWSPQTTLSLHSAAGAGDQERVTHQAHKLTLSLHSARVTVKHLECYKREKTLLFIKESWKMKCISFHKTVNGFKHW